MEEIYHFMDQVKRLLARPELDSNDIVWVRRLLETCESSQLQHYDEPRNSAAKLALKVAHCLEPLEGAHAALTWIHRARQLASERKLLIEIELVAIENMITRGDKANAIAKAKGLMPQLKAGEKDFKKLFAELTEKALAM